MNKRFKTFFIYISLFSYLILSNVAAYSTYLEKSFKQELKADKKSETDTKDKQKTRTVILPDFTLEAVVHAPAMIPGQALLIVYRLSEPLLEIAFPCVDTPRPLISYLINTFCKTIVINAP